MRPALGASLVILLFQTAYALQDPQFVEVRFHRVHLKNGNFIDGDLIRETDSEVGLKLRIGEMSIRRDQVLRIEPVTMRSLKELPEAPKPLKPAPRPEPAPFIPRTHPQPPRPAPPKVEDESLPPLPTPPGVPEEVRRGIDRAITSWNAAPQNDKPNIAPEIRKAARDGFPYLCLLIEKRMTMVPVNVLCAELGTIGDIRAIPALRAVLGTESARDREAAVTALLKIGKPECLNPLIEALNDPADTVWRPISELLVRKFNRGELPNLPSILESSLEKAESRQGYVITLGNMVGSQAHDTLLNLLRNGGDTERREALQGLSARPSAEDAELVLPLLGRGERSLRQEACLYLGKTKHQPAVPDLIRLLEREEGGIAANAHWALREITGEKMDANPEAWRQWYERSDLKKKLEP